MMHPSFTILNIIKDRSELFYFECEQQKQRISCVKCQQVLLEPYQTECGCRLCYSCLEECAEREESHCPGCNTVMHSPKNYSKYDKAIEKEIFELKIKCTKKGCDYSCKVKNLDHHLETCEYKEEKCSACEEYYPRIELKQHKELSCKMIISTCKDCGVEMRKDDLEKMHRNVKEPLDNLCCNWKDVCPFKCSENTQESIKDHLRSCEKRPVECVLNEVGCSKVLMRAEMIEHLSKEVTYHTELLMKRLNLLREEHKDLTLHVSLQNEKNNTEIKSMKEIISTLVKEKEELKIKLEQVQNMYEKLENERNMLMSSSVVQTIEIYGEYVWKVENIIEKINNAKKGTNKQILSECFYSSNPGYKMCLKIYPNGDGSALGNHLSVYFVLMKGKYDDQLEWPFNSIISIKLLNQRRTGDDRVLNMRPNINYQCYGRPQQKYNVAAGQPHFISHEGLINDNEFLMNGSIILRVNVK